VSLCTISSCAVEPSGYSSEYAGGSVSLFTVSPCAVELLDTVPNMKRVGVVYNIILCS
jgi:hypothetical protein